MSGEHLNFLVPLRPFINRILRFPCCTFTVEIPRTSAINRTQLLAFDTAKIRTIYICVSVLSLSNDYEVGRERGLFIKKASSERARNVLPIEFSTFLVHATNVRVMECSQKLPPIARGERTGGTTIYAFVYVVRQRRLPRFEKTCLEKILLTQADSIKRGLVVV
ncbi:hypothetical protein Trydic_g18387 [Trypoxylus dichotomus]